MLNAFATPQIFIMGRIINACGFDSEELYLKYEIKFGPNFNIKNGEASGETFQSIAYEEDNINVVNFDQPLSLNLSCRSINGWPKIFVEVWSNDSEGKNVIVGYGTGFIPVKSGFSKMTINCWRPSGSSSLSLEERLLGNNKEFNDKSAVYSTAEKFGVFSMSTGQVNIELELIFKDFILHGIEI